jgi:gliding motility-associated-like protein
MNNFNIFVNSILNFKTWRYKYLLVFISIINFSQAQTSFFTLNGSAQDFGTGEYSLTPASGGKVGSIWYTDKISLDESFELNFEMYFGTRDGNGADGLTFALQPISTSIGVSGGGLGIAGVQPSFFVEFDTYRNGGDPSFDHMAIQKNGNVNNTSANNLAPAVMIKNGVSNVENGAWYPMQIKWDANLKKFDVYVDCQLRLTYTGDIVNSIFSGNDQVFWGFTASTGGHFNNQKIRRIKTNLVSINDENICYGENVQISLPNTGGTFNWNTSVGVNNVTSLNPTLNPLATTEYIVTYNGSCGSTVKDTFMVFVDTLIANLGEDITVCLEESLTLNIGNSGADYLWNTGETSQTISVSNSGNYSVTVTNSNGCSDNDDITVTFEECGCTNLPLAPTVNGTSGDTIYNFYFDARQELNVNTPVFENGKRYRSKVTGTWTVWNDDPNRHVLDAAYRFGEKNSGVPLTIPVESSGPKINGSTDLRPFPNFFNPNHEYWYYFNGNGSSYKYTFTDSYSDNNGGLNFTFFELADTIEVCVEDNIVSLESYVTGTNILWYTSSSDGIGSANAPQIDKSSPGIYTYYVSQTIDECESPRAPIIYRVNELPIVDLGADKTICQGDSITLDAQNIGASYDWNNGSTNQKITVNSAGIYGVVVEDNFGCSSSDSMTLTIQQLPIVDLGSDKTICVGDSLTLDAQNTGLDYTWNTGSANQKIIVNTDGIYGVVVEDNFGCTASDSMSLTIQQLPIVDLGSDKTICVGDSLTLDAQNTGLDYTWNTGSANQKIIVNTDGIYGVVVEDNFGCTASDSMSLTIQQLPIVDLGDDQTICQGDSITLDAQNTGLDYTWNTGSTNQKITINADGIYGVVVQDNLGCIGSDSMTLTIQQLPIVDLGDDQTICQGDSITLDAQNTGLDYSWNTGSTNQKIIVNTDGIYGVVVQDNLGCIGSDSMTLTIQQLPEVDLGADQTICEGDSLTLDAQNTGLDYTWNTGSSNQKITINTDGIYGVVVEDNLGCIGSDSMILTIQQLPIVDLGADQTICEGDSLTLDVQNTGLGYSWNSGSTNQKISVNSNGIYGVVVEDNLGCIGSDSMELTVDVIPDLFSKKSYKLCVGSEIEISADNHNQIYQTSWMESDSESDKLLVSSNGIFNGIVSSPFCMDTFAIEVFSVDTPDVFILNKLNQEKYCFDNDEPSLEIGGPDADLISAIWYPNYERSNVIYPTEEGKYTLIATKDNCDSKYSIKLDDYCKGRIYVPNAFTPNDDGLNDVFLPVTQYINDYLLIIYNRWGEVVFTTNNPSDGWDGRGEFGNISQVDVYIYKINYTIENPQGGYQEKSLTGTVTLLL